MLSDNLRSSIPTGKSGHSTAEIEQIHRWDEKSEQMLKELLKMRESIDEVKKENEDLRDQR